MTTEKNDSKRIKIISCPPPDHYKPDGLYRGYAMIEKGFVGKKMVTPLKGCN